MILVRYIMMEVSKPFLAACPLLALLYASYTAARLLTDAVQEFLPVETVVALVLLKTLVSLEVLVPIAFYLSVVAGLGRLYSDSEMNALFAAGVTPRRVLRGVLYPALIVAAAVAVLSLYGRPWAYDTAFRLEASAEGRLHLERLKAGRFISGQRGAGAMFANAQPDERHWRGVFVQREGAGPGRMRVLYAREARGRAGQGGEPPVVVFRDGWLYELTRTGSEAAEVVRFETYTLVLRDRPVPPAVKHKNTPTSALQGSQQPEDLAEFQWRLSNPLSTLLLGLLAFPLARGSPRSGKYARLGIAIGVYLLYYSVLATARTLVEEGTVGAIPGIWWAPALLAVALGLAYSRATSPVGHRSTPLRMP